MGSHTCCDHHLFVLLVGLLWSEPTSKKIGSVASWRGCGAASGQPLPVTSWCLPCRSHKDICVGSLTVPDLGCVKEAIVWTGTFTTISRFWVAPQRVRTPCCLLIPANYLKFQTMIKPCAIHKLGEAESQGLTRM